MYLQSPTQPHGIPKRYGCPFVNEGRNVLLSDVDVVWLRPPEKLLTKMLETGADVMSTTDCLSPSADEAKLWSQLTAFVLPRVKQRCSRLRPFP